MSEREAIIRSVLTLLQDWGPETGLEKLHNAADDAGAEDRQMWLLISGWLQGEVSNAGKAREYFKDIELAKTLETWALVVGASLALRQHDYATSHDRLNQAAKSCGQDRVLEAHINHYRGALFYHEGKDDASLSELRNALSLFGYDHFALGRVLDSLGMVYAAKNDFHAAREFFERSLESKLSFQDRAGLAISHGQLGRLYLEWGHLRKAEEHFKQDLELARGIDDKRGEAQMYNYLGRVSIVQNQWDDAAAWLNKSLQLNQDGGWQVAEGFARKDLALVYLAQGSATEAEVEITKAFDLFKGTEFEEGLAHVKRARALLLRAREEFDGAEDLLRSVLSYFEMHGETAEAARTQLEQARLLRARGLPHPLVTESLSHALDRAEQCRRDPLVREIEAELAEVDEAAYFARIYRRSRGRNVSTETVSLLSGERETATVLFLDVQGSTEFTRVSDPEVVMMTLNQMMAEFETVLERHSAVVTAYLGDGFMALLRGTDHAKRGVLAGLEMVAALKEFNSPREILRLRPLNVRIGIASGEVFIGNVGTYHKMDFTAIGTTANLAARLQSEAEPGLPCISQTTYEQVHDRFIFRGAEARRINLKGLGWQEAWDVLGRPADE